MANDSDKELSYYTEFDYPIKSVYDPQDLCLDYQADLGNPGNFPYTRGIYARMYREQQWQVRQYCGYGLPEQTNERAHYICDEGGKGRNDINVLNIILDLPTLLGYDSDDPAARYEVGKVGVALDNLEDMEELFRGFDLTNTFFNFPASGNGTSIWALYLALARKWGVPQGKLAGATVNAPFEAFTVFRQEIFPLMAHLRLCVDLIEYNAQRIPHFSPVVLGENNFRESGAAIDQGLAFALAEGIAYVEACLARGLDVDDFVPRFSFYMNTGRDFFGEIAKYRATRRMWSRIMKDRFGAKKPRSMVARITCRTNGSMLTAQQPLNNTVRSTLEALSSVLGGVQSLTITPYDEVLSLPSRESVTIALRTHDILAHESGVRSVADPFGGSYFMEKLTRELEAKVDELLAEIEKMGEGEEFGPKMLTGMIKSVQSGFLMREIIKKAYERKKKIDDGTYVVVGVNRATQAWSNACELSRVDPAVREIKIKRLQSFRSSRNSDAVTSALTDLRVAAQGKANLVEPMVEAYFAGATIGEVTRLLKDVLGEAEAFGW